MTERWTSLLRWRYRVSAVANRLLGRQQPVFDWQHVPFYRELWKEAAAERGLEFVPLSDHVWELGREGTVLTRIDNCYVELDDPATFAVTGSRTLIYQLVSDAGLPVPDHDRFTLASLETLRTFVADHASPYVIKPAGSPGAGVGVSTGVQTYDDCVRAATRASLHGSDLMVERFIAGDTTRLLFVGGEFACAASRPAAGGGEVRSAPQARPARSAFTRDVTDELCEELVSQARRAAGAVRSNFCSVDIITPDLGVGLESGPGVIADVNAPPALHHHYGLAGGDPARDSPAQVVLDYILATQGAR